MNSYLNTLNSNILLIIFSHLFFFSATAIAQETGSISGQVIDELGGAVVNSEVALTDKNGRTKKTLTDKTGNYFFRSLIPDVYTLQVDSKDFALFESGEILVTAGQAQSFNIQLKVKPISESVAVDLNSKTKSEPDNNFGEVVLREKEVNDLPEDPDALAAALKAMAPLGPGDPQIFVDGFNATNPPPKQTIREIRISQNNFSAEDDRPGGSRIQIFTKSGMDKLQGGAFFNWSDKSLNARNPFAKERAPYTYRQYGFSLSRTLIPKRGSFFASFQKLDENQNGIVSAQTLDDSLNILPLNLSFIIPRRNTYFNPRTDFQLNKNHSLTFRYSYSNSKINNLGVGELSLPARGYDFQYLQHIFQMTETAVLNPRTVNEFRFQYIRSEQNMSNTNSTPGIIVKEAFLGGSPGIGLASNKADRFELQNYITTNTKNHLMRFGVKVRSLQVTDISPSNFNGTFTFAGGEAPVLDNNYQIVLDELGHPKLTQITSLERYRRTLLLQRQGFSAADIRIRGGGATQFSIAQGNAEAKVNQTDFGAFFQDEWRLRSNLNIYLGLRYEGQTNIDDKADLAPRIAFAWVPKIGKNENTTIRGGLGLYYDRFSESYILQAQQFDGIHLQRVISSDPSLVDSFPNIPSSAVLSAFLNQQTVTKVADNIKAARSFISLINFEHKLSPNTSFYAGFSTYRTWHSIRQRNINAPLPGTFIFGQPESGTRPFGNTGEIFFIESSNGFFQNQFYAGFRSQINSTVSLSASYFLSDTKDGGSLGSLPANSYDLKSEWGRASSFSIRHRLYLSGRFEIPKMKLIFSPQIVVFSQRPFNIITGLDTNGDQVFAERPSLATTTSGPNIYNTQFGVFNVIPLPGEQIIPRNTGHGPSFFSVNTGISRTFGFGSTGKKNSANKGSSDKPYKIILSVQIQNLFNKVNLGTPIGNLSSPLFGKSTRIAGAYGFEDGSPAYNRRIEAQIRFSF